MNTKKTPLDSFDKSTSGEIFDVVKTEDLRHVYELGADSSAVDRSAKHVTVSYIDAPRWIHGRTLRARRRNFCSVISEFALPQVAHSQGPPPECSLLICRSLARTTRHDTSRTTRHARHVTHGTARPRQIPGRGSSASLLYHTPNLRYTCIYIYITPRTKLT